MDREEISRRIRAARALAKPTSEELEGRKRPVVGITVEELADRVALDGMGAKTIGNMERGDGPALKPQLREIAEACGLTYAFFEADLANVAASSADLEKRLSAIEEFIREDVVPVLPSAAELVEVEGPAPERSEQAAQPRAGTSRTAARASRQRRQGR